jgi:hypothetical protein
MLDTIIKFLMICFIFIDISRIQNFKDKIDKILNCIPGISREYFGFVLSATRNCLVSGGYRPNFEGIVFLFGILHRRGVKVSPPITNSQGQVISPGMGGKKPPKLSTFSYFSL